jgi:hypothetical protein
MRIWTVQLAVNLNLVAQRYKFIPHEKEARAHEMITDHIDARRLGNNRLIEIESPYQ